MNDDMAKRIKDQIDILDQAVTFWHGKWRESRNELATAKAECDSLKARWEEIGMYNTADKGTLFGQEAVDYLQSELAEAKAEIETPCAYCGQSLRTMLSESHCYACQFDAEYARNSELKEHIVKLKEHIHKMNLERNENEEQLSELEKQLDVARQTNGYLLECELQKTKDELATAKVECEKWKSDCEFAKGTIAIWSGNRTVLSLEKQLATANDETVRLKAELAAERNMSKYNCELAVCRGSAIENLQSELDTAKAEIEEFKDQHNLSGWIRKVEELEKQLASARTALKGKYWPDAIPTIEENEKLQSELAAAKAECEKMRQSWLEAE